METAKLQLFNLNEQATDNTPKTTSTKKGRPVENSSDVSKSTRATFEKAISEIFLSPSEENKLVRARQLLAKTAEKVSDQQLNVFLNEIQYLLDGWFDAFEKEVFRGSTLREVLRGDK